MTLKVCLDAGHGGVDSGAIHGNIKEKDIVLDIDKKINARLLKCGIETVRTRNKDITVDTGLRSKKVRESNSRYCISSHVNSALSGGFGWEIWVSKYSNKKLASEIMKNFKEIGIDTSRGIKTRTTKDGKDYYFMHRQTGNVETLIIENGFINNQKDREYLLVESNRDKIAIAIVKAICEVEGIKYIESEIIKDDNVIFSVQVGAFKDKNNANKLLSDLKKKGFDGFIKESR